MAMGSPLQVELERRSGIVALRIAGDLRVWGRPEAEQRVVSVSRSATEEPVDQLLLNLSGVTVIDTLGIRALVPLLVACTKRKIGLKVILPPGVAGEALRCVRIFEAWPQFADEQAAGA